jgi:hypothetical protein
VRQFLFVAVAALVLWYLGHFALNALWLATATDLAAGWERAIDLALLPLAALVAWAVLRRLQPGPAPRDGG